jgi:iron(III) transport system ATP-binding protein
MAFIEIRGLVRRFGSTVAVDGVSLEVEKGRLVTLLGPSGCGKTTTLRCLAGLERPDEGEIVMDGEVLMSTEAGVFVPPEARGLGMVFQSYAVWPHMTVFKNVVFPLKVRGGLSRDECRRRALEALELVGLEGLADRPATNLSGGQQQRVAVARALVYRPRVLLFDEPLSNLDAKLRERMRFELLKLQREVGITTVYVTHDQTEAMAIADQIVVMNHGRIEQIGDPSAIYKQPKTSFVAEFIGTGIFLSGTVASAAKVEGIGEVLVGDGREEFRLRCPIPPGEGPGRDVTVIIRVECLRVGKDAPPFSHNVWPAEVTHVLYLGDNFDCHLWVSGRELRAKLDPSTEIRVGERVYAWVDPRDCVVMRREDPSGDLTSPNKAGEIGSRQ